MVNITKFEPYLGFLLVKPLESQSEKLLTAPSTDNSPVTQGRVVAVGEPYIHESGKIIEMALKKGDIIVFKTFPSETIYLDNEEYRIIPFDGIRGKLNEKK